MKSKVYFIDNCEKENVIKLYNALGKKLKGNVAVKVHSGETGNQNFLRPEFWQEIINEVDGTVVEVIALADCPADSRGALSHHYQASDRHLDEAGTYGYLCDVRIPSALLLKLKEKDSFVLTLKAVGDHGLSLFGRKSGRYAMDILVKAE